MSADVFKKPWSTKLIRYKDLDDLTTNLDHKLIKVAEAKVRSCTRICV